MWTSNRILSLGLALTFGAWAQSSGDQNRTADQKDGDQQQEYEHQEHKHQPGAAREIGAGAGTAAVGPVKGAGDAAKGTAKGPVIW